MRSIVTISSLFVMVFLCSGCAFTTASINVPYQPLDPPAQVAGASDISVTVTTADDRTEYRDRVGTKKNGYGMELAPITATNNIPDTVTGAFEQELSARGFKIGPGVSLQIGLVQFYNDFKSGLFAGSADATVAFNVKILSPDGSIIFANYYEGSGTDPNIQLASGSNAQIALVKAFQAAVASAVDDPNFIKGLLTAAAAKASPTS